MILKVNLHLHTANDPKDNISYSTYEAIDHAQKHNFDVLALTCHKKITCKKEYGDYAAKKGILLIPGIEARIENKDIIILNYDKEIEKVKTFEELKNYKKNNPQIFILAPHPFVPHYTNVSLGKKLEQNISLFDAIELTVFSNKIFNFNKKAKRIAKKYNKPLIATSDTHFLKDIERGYALINAQEKTVGPVLTAIKKELVKNKLNPMGLLTMTEFIIKTTLLHFLPRNNGKTSSWTRIKKKIS